LSRIRVAPIVEGHGDASAIGLLLRRAWREVVGGEFIDVLHPIRKPKSKLIQPAELIKAVDLACLNLSNNPSEDRSFILVLFDADEDCPSTLASVLRQELAAERSHLDVAIVIANVEFETWFVAAAESLRPHFDLTASVVSDDPEGARQGKATVKRLKVGRE
jgi:Domain of unknown function (DUF4276)